MSTPNAAQRKADQVRCGRIREAAGRMGTGDGNDAAGERCGSVGFGVGGEIARHAQRGGRDNAAPVQKMVEVAGIGAAGIGRGDGREELAQGGVEGGEAGIERGVRVWLLLRADWV
jgi:hypothetical protein